MNKYTLLIVLNAPFITYAILRAVIYFKEGVYSHFQLWSRLLFWSIALCAVLFAKPFYFYLLRHGLTDSAPINLADVVLVTTTFLCLTLIIRAYNRLEAAERRLTELNEALALRDAEER